jgi:hypothetical protein
MYVLNLQEASLLEHLAAATSESDWIHALATQEAAAAGMDLHSYMMAIEQQQQAEQQSEWWTQAALAEQEAAAAGMDLHSYAAALQAEHASQQDHELALQEQAAYLEGVALYEAELMAQQAGLSPEQYACLQGLEAHLQQAQELGLI